MSEQSAEEKVPDRCRQCRFIEPEMGLIPYKPFEGAFTSYYCPLCLPGSDHGHNQPHVNYALNWILRDLNELRREIRGIKEAT